MHCLLRTRKPAAPSLAACARRSWVVLALACVACGGSDSTVTVPKLGGTLNGKYQLELKLSSTCPGAGATATFPMVMAPAGTTPYPGVQVVLDGGEPGLLELELKYTNYTLEGGFGTDPGQGVASDQATHVWVNAVGTGQVTQTTEGKGEVTSGSLRGSLEIGGDGQSPCAATDHAFTLRPR